MVGNLDCGSQNFQCTGQGSIDCTGHCPGGKMYSSSNIDQLADLVRFPKNGFLSLFSELSYIDHFVAQLNGFCVQLDG